jgi:hypothetical protein
MPKRTLLYLATDKEVFDVLMSAKLRFTEAVMLSLPRARGIFFSPTEERESLAEALALLSYDFDGLTNLLQHRESPQRSEKTTTRTLAAKLTPSQIKAVCAAYNEEVKGDDKITLRESDGRVVVNVNYTELDFGKTALLQRRRKDAELEFSLSDNETIIRMPASEKAEAVISNIKDRLEAATSKPIVSTAIELGHLKTPSARTLFLTELISNLPDYSLQNVTQVRIESKVAKLDATELEQKSTSKEKKKAEQELMGVVENVALKGQSLLTAPEYQELNKKGFYITSITWTAIHKQAPHEIVEFEATFSEPQEGKGFKYAVRGVRHVLGNGNHAKFPQPVPKHEQAPLLTLLEQTARKLLKKIKDA